MPATDFLIHRLEQRELDAAISLRARMNQELDGVHPDAEHPGWRERFREFFATRVAADDAAVFVAQMGSEPVGLSSVYQLRNHRTEIFGRPVAYITSVYVVPEQRRRGLATRLTQACIDWARTHGCRVVRLRTSRMGREVYTRMGFTPSDELELRAD
jgi:GNAT superfamily N-acetyltransferase